jgi:phosphoglycerate kinase
MVKYVDEVDFSGKRVFLRVDFNVPLDDDCRITDDKRIRAALPTIRHLVKEGARLIVASHLGRPKGQRVERYSLRPVAERMGELLEMEIAFAPDCIGPETEEMARALEPGRVLLLENLRYHKQETDNDPEFAASLAALADGYVNDAFAVSHRAHASVVGVPARVKECAAGFLMKDEITYFEKAMGSPERPVLAILGGAKVSSKLGAIENILNKVDILIIGGAMANTFLKAKGLAMGRSLVEEDLIETASSIMGRAKEKGVELLLPVDCLVADELKAGAATKVVPVDQVPEDGIVVDIGPETLDLFGKAVDRAATIVWNGPMGAFEIPGFEKGTMELAHKVGSSRALSITGGGDTNLAILRAGETDNITYMSTGGGAFLRLLEGKTLPGLDALKECGSAT